MEIVDPCILLEHNTRRWIKDCMVSILQIGVACSMESPRDRMEMGSVISELHSFELCNTLLLHNWCGGGSGGEGYRERVGISIAMQTMDPTFD
ncbi:hypothetical protein ACSBR1_030630 [Camellia fascicularis]